MNALQKLRSLVEELRAPKEPMKILDNWSLAGRLLSRAQVDDPGDVQRVVSERDIDALDAIVSRLENPEKSAEPAEPSAPARKFSGEELRHAMRAFRRRLKLMRLEDESKILGRHLTGGKTSNIDAIMPPGEFPRAIWTALEQKGELVHTGRGFFTLPGNTDRPPDYVETS